MPTEFAAAIAEITAHTIAEITDDITDGTVPATIGSFRELHDYVDANQYADPYVTALQATRPWTDFINLVTDEVDTWLRAGRPDNIRTQHTASSWHESMHLHQGEHADTLAPAEAARRARRAASFTAATTPTIYTPTSRLP